MISKIHSFIYHSFPKISLIILITILLLLTVEVANRINLFSKPLCNGPTCILCSVSRFANLSASRFSYGTLIRKKKVSVGKETVPRVFKE